MARKKKMTSDVEPEPTVMNEELDTAKEIYHGFSRARAYRKKEWEKPAEKSLAFYWGDQWSQDDKYALEAQKRPPAVFNMCLPAVDLIVGYHINNGIDFVAEPVDKYSDPMIAEIITSGIKYVENCNDISFERKFQFIEGLICGIGIIEMWNDTEHELNGKIRAEHKSSWHYYLDQDFEKYDYSDANVLYRESWMTKKQIKRLYGNAVANKLQTPGNSVYDDMAVSEVPPNFSSSPTTDYGNRQDKNSDSAYEEYNMKGYDRRNNKYRVVEEYEKMWEKVTMYQGIDGSVLREDELTDEEKENGEAVEIATITKPHIRMRTLICDSIVAGDVELPNTEFSQLFNFYFPYFLNGNYMGILENVFYPQEEINKVHSSMIHMLNTMTHWRVNYQKDSLSPEYASELETILGSPSQILEFEELYDEQGRPNIIENQPKEPPQSFFKIMQGEQGNIQYITGAQPGIQGLDRRAESGRAKLTDVQQNAIRIAGILDNLWHSHKLVDKAIVWWMQNTWTEEKYIRIRGDNQNKNQQEIIFNQQIYGMIANDITVGEYDIVMTPEAKTQSERQRLFFQYTELARVMGPEYAPILAELALDNSSIAKKDEVIAQIRQQRQMQMQMQQQQMMGGGQPPQQPQGRKGVPVQSAPRPSRGLRRMPQEMRA